MEEGVFGLAADRDFAWFDRLSDGLDGWPILDMGASLLFAAAFRRRVEDRAPSDKKERGGLFWPLHGPLQAFFHMTMAYFGGTSIMSFVMLGETPGWLLVPNLWPICATLWLLVFAWDGLYELLSPPCSRSACRALVEASPFRSRITCEFARDWMLRALHHELVLRERGACQ
jgi:hypothetical protein